MKKNILLAVCFLMPLATMAQNDTLGHERNITLSEAIVLARTQSVDAAVALNELKTAYWEYRTFRADLLPEVNFTGTLPNYNKSYSTYQNSDGSYSFVRNNTLGLSGQLSVDQNIWFTGGKAVTDFFAGLSQTTGFRRSEAVHVSPREPGVDATGLRSEYLEVEPPYRARTLCRGKGRVHFSYGRGDDENHHLFL